MKNGVERIGARGGGRGSSRKRRTEQRKNWKITLFFPNGISECDSVYKWCAWMDVWPLKATTANALGNFQDDTGFKLDIFRSEIEIKNDTEQWSHINTFVSMASPAKSHYHTAPSHPKWTTAREKKQPQENNMCIIKVRRQHTNREGDRTKKRTKFI